MRAKAGLRCYGLALGGGYDSAATEAAECSHLNSRLASRPARNDTAYMTRNCERLIASCSVTGVDHRGRIVEDVIRLSVRAMESFHDYIQWLFPLAEPSSVTANAPCVTSCAGAQSRAIRRWVRRCVGRLTSCWDSAS